MISLKTLKKLSKQSKVCSTLASTITLIITILLNLIITSAAYATEETEVIKANQNLTAIKAPQEDFNNVHVVPLGSDELASEFVIFLKNTVPAHYHTEHTELVYIVSGQGEMTLYKQGEMQAEKLTPFTIAAGDYIRIDKGMVHSVKNLGEKPLKALSIQTPEFKGKDRVFVK